MAVNGKVVAGGIAAVLALAAPLVIKWEGVSYTPYLDPVGVLTVCYGHTGSDIIRDKEYSSVECAALLAEDEATADATVRRCLKMPMLTHIEAALVSATFNIGPRVVCGSTLQKMAEANNWPGACAELDKWKYSSGRVYKGLVLRRADERAMCEGRS